MAAVDKYYKFKEELLSASVYTKNDIVSWVYKNEVGCEPSL